MSSTIQASVLYYDGFDLGIQYYTDGFILEGQNASSLGFSGSWSMSGSGAASYVNGYTTSGIGLTMTGVNTIGGAVDVKRSSGSGSGYYEFARSVDTPLANKFGLNSTIYFAFMVKPYSFGSGEYLLFSNGTGAFQVGLDTTRKLTLWAGDNLTVPTTKRINVGTDGTSGGPVFSANQAYFISGKVTIGSSDNNLDTITLFAPQTSSVPSAEPAPFASWTGDVYQADRSFSQILIHVEKPSSIGLTVIWDELRMASGYSGILSTLSSTFLYEGFEIPNISYGVYTDGSALSGQNPTIAGFSGAWVMGGAAAASHVTGVTSAGNNLSLLGLSTLGGGLDVRRTTVSSGSGTFTFTRSIDASLGSTFTLNSTTYFSFVMKPILFGADEYLRFSNGTGAFQVGLDTAGKLTLWAGDNSATPTTKRINVGTDGTGGGPAFAAGQSYFISGKVTIGASDDDLDVITLFKPKSSALPKTEPVAFASWTGDVYAAGRSFSDIVIHTEKPNSQGSTVVWDELRLATDYNELGLYISRGAVFKIE